MSNPVPQCAHMKSNGEVCGSPAVSGTQLCYHHSAIRTALKAQSNAKCGDGGFAPIPFLFPEDRAAMQINFFLLLQAYNEQRIDRRTYNGFLSLLRSMARNLGKTGSLLETGDRMDREPTSQKRDVGHPQPQRSERTSQKREVGRPPQPQPQPLKAEACFLNSVSATASRVMDPFSPGFIGEREALRTSGGRRAPLL